MYTNRRSLAAAYGDDEAEGLADTQPKFDRCAKLAYDEINDYLRTAGFVVPLVFTEFGGEPTDDLPLLSSRIQHISDAFTAWYCARGTDLSKKIYEDDRAEGIKWLEKVVSAEIRPDLPKTEELTGSGEVVVLARTSVFNTMLRREEDVFGNCN